ncbi:MAG: flavodoxin [Oscillospiraceae bacterium]|nr:flavodoxin [Oscillospiraceae bacterium]
MKKAAIVYWSGTGNTEEMAKAVAQEVQQAGAEAALLPCAQFDAAQAAQYDAITFGCAAMGAEELEDSEFEPMFAQCEGSLGGKRVALFGSYGWGDGEWMRTWEERCRQAGIDLVCDSVICNYAPDINGEDDCRALGQALVG